MAAHCGMSRRDAALMGACAILLVAFGGDDAAAAAAAKTAKSTLEYGLRTHVKQYEHVL